MISDVRDYVKQYLTSFTEHKDAFNEDNIGRTNFDRGYFVSYAVPSTENNTGFFVDTVQTELSLFFKGYRNTQEALDDAMDTAEDIRRQIINTANKELWNETSAQNMVDIIPQSIQPEPVDTNDNSIIIRLSFAFLIVTCND